MHPTPTKASQQPTTSTTPTTTSVNNAEKAGWIPYGLGLAQYYMTSTTKSLNEYLLSTEENYSYDPKIVDIGLNLQGTIDKLIFPAESPFKNSLFVTIKQVEQKNLIIYNKTQSSWEAQTVYPLNLLPKDIRPLSSTQLLLVMDQNSPNQILDLNTGTLTPSTTTHKKSDSFDDQLTHYGITSFFQGGAKEDLAAFTVNNVSEIFSFPLLPASSTKKNPHVLDFGSNAIIIMDYPRASKPIVLNIKTGKGNLLPIEPPIIKTVHTHGTVFFVTEKHLYFTQLNDLEASEGFKTKNLQSIPMPGICLDFIILNDQFVAGIFDDSTQRPCPYVIKTAQWTPTEDTPIKWLQPIRTNKTKLKIAPDGNLLAFNFSQKSTPASTSNCIDTFSFKPDYLKTAIEMGSIATQRTIQAFTTMPLCGLTNPKEKND